MRFQDLFHSPPGVLFAFPSRYWFTIGRLRVFSLGGWSPRLQTGFLVSRPTFFPLGTPLRLLHTEVSPSIVWLFIPFFSPSFLQLGTPFRFSQTGLSPSMAGLSSPFC